MHDSSHTKAETNELQTATGNGRIAKRTGKSKCLEIAEILNSAIVAFLCALIKFYKKCISPLFPACCRFTPTCSAYALEALKVHGLFKGSWLAFLRICRCNPFCKGGYDPVPPRRKKEKQ